MDGKPNVGNKKRDGLQPRDLSRNSVAWSEAKEDLTRRSQIFTDVSFDSMGLHPYLSSILKAPLEKGGFDISSATKVQKLALPLLMAQDSNVINDAPVGVLVKSQTGSGKTLTYLLPVMQELMTLTPAVTRSDGTLALVIAPTRELSNQIYDVLERLTKVYVKVVPGSISGGEKKKSEKTRLRKGVSVLVATPGRLLDHLKTTESFLLTKLRFLIVDEVDRLFDMGFEKTMQEIFAMLQGNNYNNTISTSTNNSNNAIKSAQTLVQRWQLTSKHVAQPQRLKIIMVSATVSISVQTVALQWMKKFVLVDADYYNSNNSTTDPSNSHLSGAVSKVISNFQELDEALNGRFSEGQNCNINANNSTSNKTTSKTDNKEKAVVHSEDGVLVFGDDDEDDIVNNHNNNMNLLETQKHKSLRKKYDHSDSENDSDIDGDDSAAGDDDSSSDDDSDDNSDIEKINLANNTDNHLNNTKSDNSTAHNTQHVPSTLQQFSLTVGMKWRLAALLAFLKLRKTQKIVVFFSTCDSVDFHALLLKNLLWPRDLGPDPSTLPPSANLLNAFFAHKNTKTTNKSGNNNTANSSSNNNSAREHLDPLDWRFVSPLLSADNTHNTTNTTSNTNSSSNNATSSTNIYRLHGKVPQHIRRLVAKDFAKAKSGILLCTDVAARGLDLPSVQWIVQYDPPSDTNDYVHRIGRTARRGSAGNAVLFLLPSEVLYLHLLSRHGLTLTPLSSQSMLNEAAKLIPLLNDKEKNFKNVDELAAVSLQRTAEGLVGKKALLTLCAIQAYRSFLRAYGTRSADCKGIFKLTDLHLGHAAKAFALHDKPSDFSLNNANANKFNNKNNNNNSSSSSSNNAAHVSSLLAEDVIGKVFNGDFSSPEFREKLKNAQLPPASSSKNVNEKADKNNKRQTSSNEEDIHSDHDDDSEGEIEDRHAKKRVKTTDSNSNSTAHTENNTHDTANNAAPTNATNAYIISTSSNTEKVLFKSNKKRSLPDEPSAETVRKETVDTKQRDDSESDSDIDDDAKELFQKLKRSKTDNNSSSSSSTNTSNTMISNKNSSNIKSEAEVSSILVKRRLSFGTNTRKKGGRNSRNKDSNILSHSSNNKKSEIAALRASMSNSEGNRNASNIMKGKKPQGRNQLRAMSEFAA